MDENSIRQAVSSAVMDLLAPINDRLRALEATAECRRDLARGQSSQSNGSEPKLSRLSAGTQPREIASSLGMPKSGLSGGSLLLPPSSSSGQACSSDADLNDTTSGQVASCVDVSTDDPEHAPVSSDIKQFLQTRFRKPLKGKERRDLVEQFSRPEVDVAVTPKLDHELLNLPGVRQSFKRSRDNMLYSLQSSVLDCFGPLSALMMEAKAAQDAGAGLDPQAVLDMVPAGLSLLGNANSKLSVLRRQEFLEHLDKSLVPMAEEPFDKAGTALFGPELLERIQSKAESQEALGLVVKQYKDARAPPQSSDKKSGSGGASAGERQFFRGTGVSRYGGGSRYEPYTSPYNQTQYSQAGRGYANRSRMLPPPERQDGHGPDTSYSA